ncbi:POT family-domain-containing protein [Lipomyces tetrasporus]|uniref:POT family-domain-containing protein n=1 Tax=Lipomyces tetrasporus TaxID=54092 RepID=A0AAD7QN07_9ASCO|nr:POT family-domain-containing protein [Lipomyces tetrasporus]KAJ8097980.1 POT family-domain-containing protein [Lipomyces tetrasporus]
MAGRISRPSNTGYLPLPSDDTEADSNSSNLDTFSITRSPHSEEVSDHPLATKKDINGDSIVDAERALPVYDNKYTDSSVSDEEISEHDLRTLRRVADRLPPAAWLVAIVELCERFTFYGLTGPFMNYMQNAPGGLRPGAIGLGQSKASALNYFFQFWSYVTPILGAVIADQYWGKYKTISVFAGIYAVGLLIIFTTSLPVAIDSGASLGGLITAMIVVGLGTGGIKSNVSPLIAEQYTNTKRYIKELKTGERVIVDPSVTIQSLFMIFYLCINIGSLSAIATTELELHVGFWAAYLLPFAFFFIGIFALIIGRPYYVKKPPRGSVIPNAFRILCIASTKRKIIAAKPSYRAEHGMSAVPWTDRFVDEVNRALIACQVFVFFPIYWVVYGQMMNNFISQAGEMDTHGIPNDIMQNIDPIAIIIFIPICDSFVYPYLRRVGIPFKPITRIFFGFIFAAIAMAYAAIVQHLIYTAGPCYEYPLACDASEGGLIPNNVHVAIQTPAYFFIAMSEIFASVTGLEYAYTKAPSSMKSFVMSMFLLTNALGSALGIAISPTAKDPDMVWTYTSLAIITAFFGCVFFLVFRRYNKDEDVLNNLDNETFDELVEHDAQGTLNTTA